MPNWLWAVIANLVVAVVLAFGAYIWRGQEARVKRLEVKDEGAISKLLAHPVLTVDVHQAICGKKMDEVKEFVGDRMTALTAHMDEFERRNGLLIENAILKANGKGKGSKRGK